MDMVSKKLVINCHEGLHLRPATNLCKVAIHYDAKITLQVRNVTANVKSVLNILAAQVKEGEEVTFLCDGPDEELALKEITELVDRGMDIQN